MAHTTYVGAGCMSAEYAVNVLPVKLHLRYDEHWVMTLGNDGIQPAGFGDRITWVPFCFYVNRPDDGVTGTVSLIILGQVVVADPLVVAVAKRDTGMVAQPGVIIS